MIWLSARAHCEHLSHVVPFDELARLRIQSLPYLLAASAFRAHREGDKTIAGSHDPARVLDEVPDASRAPHLHKASPSLAVMANLNLATPVHTPSTPPCAAPESTPSGPVTCVQIRILVIDDDQDVCGLISRILAQEGYLVETLTDPTRTIEVLRKDTFHIVLLDLVMPGVSGMDILDHIRRFDADIAVVIVTGFPSVESATQSIKHSVSDYLSKPFPPEKLRDTIAQILRKKGLKASPEEELHATIGRTIRQLRQHKKLTLKQLNRRTGLSVSLLSQIERAESSASVSSLYKIAAALECRLTDLFGSF